MNKKMNFPKINFPKINRDKLHTLLFILIAIGLLLPTLFTVLHTYPMLDDFGYGVTYREYIQNGYNAFTGAIYHAYRYYMDFSGFYTAAFLDLLFSWVITNNPWKLRILCFIIALLFYAVLFIFIKTVLKNICKIRNNEKIYFTYLMILLCFTNIEEYSENFYWYVCVMSYLLLAVIILAGLSLFIYAVSKHSYRYLIAACIIGFLGCGGSLNVAAFNCIFYFLIGLWSFFVKQQKKYALFGFSSAFLGAVFNVLAPGNYIRYGQPLTLHWILVAVYQSVVSMFERLYWMMTESTLLFVAIIVIVFLLLSKPIDTKFRYPVPFLFSACSLLAIVAVIFPVMLGYQGVYSGDRWIFYSDMAIYFFLIINLFYWRGYLNRKYAQIRLEKNQLPAISIIIFLCFCGFLGNHDLHDFPLYKMSASLLNGDVKEYSDYWLDISKTIEQSEEKSLIICKEPIENHTGLYEPGYNYEDGTGILHVALLKYYQKDSILIRLVEDDN